MSLYVVLYSYETKSFYLDSQYCLIMKKYTEQRPWGKFEQYTDNEVSTVKVITVKPNSNLSYQYHNYRDELWRVIEGEGIIVLDDKEYLAKKDDDFFIPKKAKHRMKTKDKELRVLEISFGKFDEEDIVRLEDSYGRV